MTGAVFLLPHEQTLHFCEQALLGGLERGDLEINNIVLDSLIELRSRRRLFDKVHISYVMQEKSRDPYPPLRFPTARPYFAPTPRPLGCFQAAALWTDADGPEQWTCFSGTGKTWYGVPETAS